MEQNQRFQNNRRDNRSAPPKVIRAENIPDDFVEIVETSMEGWKDSITTSKLRNILSLAANIYNEEELRTDDVLLPENSSAVQFMRIRIAYEAGRDRNKTGRFIENAKLLEYCKGIGDSRKNLVKFYHYVEALVAYHRYFGGRE